MSRAAESGRDTQPNQLCILQGQIRRGLQRNETLCLSGDYRALTAMPKLDNSVFQLGDVRVDPALDEIRKDGVIIKLEPRTMRLLVCLAERAGQVVSVDELLDLVWKDVVVSPDSVYRAVASLRRALGDDAKEPTYIANVTRRGYRLVAPISSWVAPTTAQLGNGKVPGAVEPVSRDLIVEIPQTD